MVLDRSIQTRRQRRKRWKRIYCDGARCAGSLRGEDTGNDAPTAEQAGLKRSRNRFEHPLANDWKPCIRACGIDQHQGGVAERCAGANAKRRLLPMRYPER